MKVAAIAGSSDKAGANDEVAEMLAGLALSGIGRKQRIELTDDGGMIDVLGVELG